MENLSNSADGNLPYVSGDETLKKAKESCIKLLEYRIKHHVEVVIDTVKEVWRLVLRDSVNKEENSLTVTSYNGIICSGYGDVPQEISDKQKNLSVRLSEDLVLVKLQKQANDDIYYVLSDTGKKSKVVDATSTAELECHGKILCISKGQDPPEAMSCEIIKKSFCTDKKSCSSIDQRYIEIIRNGDVQALKKEVFDVVNINCTYTENGWTMLHHAAYHGNLEIVSFLTSIGYNLHAQDSICARKPVHISAREGRTDIIEFFLLHGLSVNEADQIGWTLLHYAAWKGHLEAVRFLIQKKAEVDIKDKCLGKTPLLVATEEGHLEVVELLVSSGSNIEEKANEGETPLLVAAFKGYMKVVEFLVDNGANLDAVEKDGSRPIHCAAFRGHLNVVEFLADKGANLNAASQNGLAPLHYAAFTGHLNVVEFLVSGGADVNALDKLGKTPLDCGAEHIKVASYLADKMINIFQNQDKFEDALKFYRELQQLQKKKYGHVHPGTLIVQTRIVEMLYDQCQYSEALDILKDVLDNINYYEAAETVKEMFNIQEADLSTNHCIKCQEPITLIPKQDEVVKMVNEDINEGEAEVGNVNDNSFRQTKASDFKTRFERKASEFLKNGKSIYGCMIIFWLFSMICHHAILCFQQ